MEVRELMPRNWITTDLGETTRVDAYMLYEMEKGAIDKKYILPIPLTNDFWLKNGFVYQKDDNSYTLFDDYYSINAKEVNDGLWQIVVEHCEIFNDTEICSVSYVHQLQQFLNLCGIDIEIKL